MGSDEENTEEDRSRRSEEGRVLVGLGLLAVAVAYRNQLPKTFPYPLGYPTPHLQVFTIPVFDSAVFIFGVYSACMGFYFSADRLPYFWRKLAQRAGHAFLVAYLLTLLWDLTFGLGGLLVPDALVIPYAVLYYLSLVYIILLGIDITADKWGRTNRTIFRGVDKIYSASKPHLIVDLKALWSRSRKWTPTKVQRVVRSLAWYLGLGHEFPGKTRQAFIIMFPTIIIGFFVTRQIQLSQGFSQDTATLWAFMYLVFAILVTIRYMILASRGTAT